MTLTINVQKVKYSASVALTVSTQHSIHSSGCALLSLRNPQKMVISSITRAQPNNENRYVVQHQLHPWNLKVHYASIFRHFIVFN